MGRCPQEWQGRERHGRLQGVRLHRRRAELGLGCVQEGGETGEVRRGLLLRPGGYEGQAALRFQRLLHDDAECVHRARQEHSLLHCGVGSRQTQLGGLPRQGAWPHRPQGGAERLPARGDPQPLAGARAGGRAQRGRQRRPRLCLTLRGHRRADELAGQTVQPGRLLQGDDPGGRQGGRHQAVVRGPPGQTRRRRQEGFALRRVGGHGRAGVPR
mmetsp:Transcript_106028/g.276931  ORF Transcript_106028/g.276931 Transcript_106028/m.276931 type:complete len:214 (+) Transcript_106028:394-1035(+)